MTRRFVAMRFYASDAWGVWDEELSAWVRLFAPWIDGPECEALAEAEADRLEAAHGPEWVVANSGAALRSKSGVIIRVYCDTPPRGSSPVESGNAFRAHICRLLNEHGGPQ